jgi:hypothetical protein
MPWFSLSEPGQKKQALRTPCFSAVIQMGSPPCHQRASVLPMSNFALSAGS